MFRVRGEVSRGYRAGNEKCEVLRSTRKGETKSAANGG